MTKFARYRHVRALARGLKVLVEINRIGRARPGEIAAETGVDRTTVYRLLDTLEQEGYITRGSDDYYTLTLDVRRLSDGFSELDHITRVVAPELGRLLPKVLWPTDFATFEQGAMIIRETTHRFSHFSMHRAMIGRSRPVLRSAMGRAVLANVSPAERELMLRMIIKSKQPDAGEARDQTYVRALLRETLARGYAASVGLVETHISAIAVPVRSQSHVVGALNLVFFRSAMNVEEAAERYLPHLRNSAASIKEVLAEAGNNSSRFEMSGSL